MLLAPEVGTGLLWVGALGHATSGLAWNSVGMVAVVVTFGLSLLATVTLRTNDA